jgi:CxxC-x17-CxxC domain-containing protein
MGNFRPNNGNRSGRDDRRGPSRFGNNNRSGGRGGFGRDRNSGRSDRRSQEMHDVTCDKCGKECQVPFKPSGNKPVLCSDCFRNNSDSRSNNSRNQDRPSQSGISQEQFETLNKKLDKILSVLEDLELEDEEYEEEEDNQENQSEEKTDTKEDKAE